MTHEDEQKEERRTQLQPRSAGEVVTGLDWIWSTSRAEEPPDEADAAEQEAAPAAAGVLPRGRRHLQVRVRRALQQRVPDHVYVPEADVSRHVLRRGQDVAEAGVPVLAAVVVAPGAAGDLDRRRLRLGTQLEVAERRARQDTTLPRRRQRRSLRHGRNTIGRPRREVGRRRSTTSRSSSAGGAERVCVGGVTGRDAIYTAAPENGGRDPHERGRCLGKPVAWNFGRSSGE
jgi:hypothetical protein